MDKPMSTDVEIRNMFIFLNYVLVTLSDNTYLSLIIMEYFRMYFKRTNELSKNRMNEEASEKIRMNE